MSNLPIDLWLLYQNPAEPLPAELIMQLPAAQQQRAARFSGKRWREFALSRLLLLHALTEKKSWAIVERENRAPEVSVDSHACTVSVSHSQGWVGVIVGRHSILGLDIEKIRPRLRRATAEYFCSDQQLDTLETLPEPEQQRYLTRLWTQKEAYFKAYQQPILNPSTRELSFSGENRADGYIYSAALDNEFELSVFSEVPITIKPQFLQINSQGQLIAAKPGRLRWMQA